MTLKDELEGLFGAAVPLINLVTYEEERVIKTVEAAAPAHSVYTWDLADGFTTVRAGKEALPQKDLASDTLLPHLATHAPRNCIVILKDFHHAWNSKKAFVTRKLRNMAPALRGKGQFLLFITPALDLPLELKDDVVVLHVALPDHDELGRLFGEVTHAVDRAGQPTPAVRDKLISSALGLTTNQARLAYSRAYATGRRFDERSIDVITAMKREVIRESGALEFWPAGEGESIVGGLDKMKEWLRKRGNGFSSEAQAAGLPFPRGAALIGIPGTGKSLSAKMLSGLWKLPLLRLDVGALFGSLLGESEHNMRKAIQLAETVCPCILWIDEMEKAFAGSGAGALNSGAATRVFGTFLTWMQEHRTPVYVLATANDVTALPVELMARFDRTFFLDLPNEVELRQIFTIHLKRAGVAFPERTFRLDELVDRTRGFVGREIERVVRDAQFTAFDDENREVAQADLEKAIDEVIPVQKSHAGIIEELRRWKTEGRAFPASSEDTPVQAKRGRVIESV